MNINFKLFLLVFLLITGPSFTDESNNDIAFYTGKFDIKDEVGDDEIKASSMVFTSSEDEIQKAKFHIIAVPTPINQDKTPTVKLAFDNNSIKIMASSTESNKGDEEVPANYTSSPLEILFNSKYLLDLRDVLESQNINLELLNQSSPVIVKDPDDQKSVYILMPMRV